MSGYSISLYKFMQVDENLQKKERLLAERKNVFDNQVTMTNHSKFVAYGEFDRIGLEKVDKFSKYRDSSEKARSWIGDRQIHLVYSICEEDCKDELFYENGDFYELDSDERAVKSNRLFIGMTILQFKYSEQKNVNSMEAFLYTCKTRIIGIVKESDYDVKCAVFGTLGSFGLTIIWLADQYTDILKLVTQIRNSDVGKEEGGKKSIFFSAYTIFAQNHENGVDWKQRIDNIQGRAILRITLKKGLREEVCQQLNKWKKADTQIYHCAGEHDVIIRMESSKAFGIFERGNFLHFQDPFFKKYVLQTNVQFCEVLEEQNKVENVEYNIENKNTESDVLLKLRENQVAYKKLRIKFANMFPSTAGMVDTLDLLYSDYISKVSTASNEMWISNFSYQFFRVLTCICDFCDKMDKLYLAKEKSLKIINNLLSSFERQISHMAESNNLILGTPNCQFRYLGQNNLTLYAYFGIIKNILEYVYETQEVSAQDEIVPLLVTDIVPIIESTLYLTYNDIENMEYEQNLSKIVTIHLPMVSLYNPVCYYPYLYHEIFHYVVPRDRYVRNRIYGCLISIEMLFAILKNLIAEKIILQNEQEKKWLDEYSSLYLVRHVYAYVVENYDDYIGKIIEELSGKNLSYQEVTQRTQPAERYEKKLFLKWVEWLGKDNEPELNNNPLYLFFCYLYSHIGEVENEIDLWNRQVDDNIELKNFKQRAKGFFQGLAGIADNLDPQGMKISFGTYINMLGEEILDPPYILIGAVKEAMADTAMVAMANLDFAEYLLLFTRTKKDLLFGCNQKNIQEQDIIRVGMILDFLQKNGRDQNIYVDDCEENFIYMYCGFYFSSRRNDKEYYSQLYTEAKKWFEYWKKCCVRYGKRYRIYAMLLRDLQNMLLISSAEGNEKLAKIKEDNKHYWKEYAKSLKRYGQQMYANIDGKSILLLQERRAEMDADNFKMNIQLIYKYQHQEEFSELDKLRNSRIDGVQSKVYDKDAYKLNEKVLPIMQLGNIQNIAKQMHWEYEIEDIGRLSTLIAEIACQLKESGNRILGEGEQAIWYRGHQSDKYILVPSIMRKYKEMKAKAKNSQQFYLSTYLRKEFEEFKFRADGAIETIERTSYTESDYIALMQHHSVASNFLDWTEDALSALYFALESFLDNKAKKANSDSVLYILSPALYNYVRKKIIVEEGDKDSRRIDIEKDICNQTINEGIPNLTVSYNAEKYYMYLLGKEELDGTNVAPYKTKEDMEEKQKYYMPIAIYVSRLNRRIQAQSGIFMAYNVYTNPDEDDKFDYISLEEIQKRYLNNYKGERDTCPFLYKIKIKERQREKIAEWIKVLGMSKEKCYPELSNIGERIMR